MPGGHGDGEKQIICGAPNAREGITVVVASPGTYVPGIDTTIGVGRIRGVESHGMMCSEREMELSDEHEGIIELPSGEVGQRFTDWLAQNDPARVDPVIEIAITPNRPDALGVRGIALDLAARGLGTMKPAPEAHVEAHFPCPVDVTIDATTPRAGLRGLCRPADPRGHERPLAAMAAGPAARHRPAPDLGAGGHHQFLHLRPKPPAARLRRRQGLGRSARAPHERAARRWWVSTRRNTPSAREVVISDDAAIESIGGIMGGLATGCTEETVNVFLEAARLGSRPDRRTGRALRINSDARYRNERGIDPAFNMDGLDLATRMILDLCGGEPSERVVAGAVPDVGRAYRLDPARVRSLVGMDIPEAEQRRTLTALGFRLEGDMAHVPSWRPDVMGEADLVEEVARIASLTRLEGGRCRGACRRAQADTVSVAAPRAGGAAHRAALGYNECVTYSFIDHDSARLFGGGGAATMLANPISSEMSHMRPDLLPGLLQAAARNQARGIMDLALFEVGHAFHGGEPGEQHLQVAGLLVGRTGPKDVHGTARPVDLFDARADSEAILQAIGAPRGADPARRARLVAPRPPRPHLPRAEESARRLR